MVSDGVERSAVPNDRKIGRSMDFVGVIYTWEDEHVT